MDYTFIPEGVCSRRFELRVTDDGVLERITIEGGCDGNLQAVARLVRGRPVDEIIALLEGIRCEASPTSCPDQLARALRKIQRGQKA